MEGGIRARSRSKKTWREVVQKDCQARKLNREDAVDRSSWRKQIKMIDDQDRCERVNVSSGTGSAHPGSLGQMPPPLSSDNQHLSYDVCLEVRGEIIRTVLFCIVSSSYSSLDWVLSHWAHVTVHRFIVSTVG